MVKITIEIERADDARELPITAWINWTTRLYEIAGGIDGKIVNVRLISNRCRNCGASDRPLLACISHDDGNCRLCEEALHGV